MTTTVDVGELHEAIAQWADDVVFYAVGTLGEELDERCPVSEGTGFNSPGFLRDSRQSSASGLSASIDYLADYASYVSEGTEAHVIEGNPLLSFFWAKVGKVIVTHSVNHPGTEANPWWTDTMTDDNWTSHLLDAAETIPFS